jgi:hypothetical protein
VQIELNNVDEMYFMKKKKDFYTNKMMTDQRNNLIQNFHMYQSAWLDTLKEMNLNYDRSKKELITLNRFNYKISEIKNFDQAIKINDRQSIVVY